MSIVFILMNYEPLKIEQEILEFWSKKKIFDKLRKKLARSKKTYSYLDGPITANNPMGVHHAWGRTYKDVFQRFWAMRGYNQRWQNGFDCQGLWIEREVEKDKGFKSKKDIDDFGLLNFVKACKDRAETFSKLQTDDSIRLGQWMDWDHSYYTMTDINNEHNWMLLKEYHKKGWLYKGKDVVPWCPRCGTASSKHDIVTEGYREVKHTGLYMKFPVIGKENEYLLIFTTTPWIVPANVAAAVNENLEYAKVQHGNSFYWIVEARAQHVLPKDHNIIEKVSGKDLVGLRYEEPYSDMPEQNKASHEVVAWDLATAEEGTGIVHIAPGCGPEDFQLGKKLKMPSPSPLDEAGNYHKGWHWLSGKYAMDANPEIIEDLNKRNFVFKTESHIHRYPHCWRCSTELVFRLEDEWYIKCDEIRSKLRKENQKIKWYPNYGKVRQDDWFEAMHDWLISRKRYWGLPLPFWICTKCNALEVIGSVKELKQKAISGMNQLKELHRPWIDNVILRCPKCKGEMKRVPDVGDAWLDAGIVPFSTIGPYMQNKKEWAKWYPADFICENMPGQYRGWFNALFWASVALTGEVGFKSVLGYESVKDENGKEMHKSAGNVIWAKDALIKIGADPLRWRYCMHDPTVEVWLGYKFADEAKKTLNVLLNLGEYLKTLLPRGFKPKNVQYKKDVDKWIISRLESTKKAVTEQLENLRPDLATQTIQNFFLEDFSRGYVHFIRDTISANDKEKETTIQVLYTVLLDTLQLMGPFVPFITEKIYQSVFTSVDKKESIHLSDWPEYNEKIINIKLENSFSIANEIITAVLAAREKGKIGIRWPLQKVTIYTEDTKYVDAIESLKNTILNQCNLKEVVIVNKKPSWVTTHVKINYDIIAPRAKEKLPKIVSRFVEISSESIKSALLTKGKFELAVEDQVFELHKDDVYFIEQVPTTISPAEFSKGVIYLDLIQNSDLLNEGFVREIIRKIQSMRKDADMIKTQKANIVIATEDKVLKHTVEKYANDISKRTNTSLRITFGNNTDERINESFELKNKKIKIGLSPK